MLSEGKREHGKHAELLENNKITRKEKTDAPHAKLKEPSITRNRSNVMIVLCYKTT